MIIFHYSRSCLNILQSILLSIIIAVLIYYLFAKYSDKLIEESFRGTTVASRSSSVATVATTTTRSSSSNACKLSGGKYGHMVNGKCVKN